jgi:hypothetical protein
VPPVAHPGRRVGHVVQRLLHPRPGRNGPGGWGTTRPPGTSPTTVIPNNGLCFAPVVPGPPSSTRRTSTAKSSSAGPGPTSERRAVPGRRLALVVLDRPAAGSTGEVTSRTASRVAGGDGEESASCASGVDGVGERSAVRVPGRLLPARGRCRGSPPPAMVSSACSACSAAGRVRNTTGGVGRTASPSIPAGTGRLAWTQKSGVTHCRQGRRRRRTPLTGGSTTVTPSRRRRAARRRTQDARSSWRLQRLLHPRPGRNGAGGWGTTRPPGTSPTTVIPNNAPRFASVVPEPPSSTRRTRTTKSSNSAGPAPTSVRGAQPWGTGVGARRLEDLAQAVPSVGTVSWSTPETVLRPARRGHPFRDGSWYDAGTTECR